MYDWYRNVPPEVYWPTSLIYYIAWGFAIYMIAKKTGTPGAWLAWVPILNFFLLLSIAELGCLFALLFLIPCLNVFAAIAVWWRVCERRRKPGILGVLMLVPGINLLVAFYLGLSD